MARDYSDVIRQMLELILGIELGLIEPFMDEEGQEAWRLTPLGASLTADQFAARIDGYLDEVESEHIVKEAAAIAAKVIEGES